MFYPVVNGTRRRSILNQQRSNGFLCALVLRTVFLNLEMRTFAVRYSEVCVCVVYVANFIRCQFKYAHRLLLWSMEIWKKKWNKVFALNYFELPASFSILHRESQFANFTYFHSPFYGQRWSRPYQEPDSYYLCIIEVLPAQKKKKCIFHSQQTTANPNCCEKNFGASFRFVITWSSIQDYARCFPVVYSWRCLPKIKSSLTWRPKREKVKRKRSVKIGFANKHAV